MPRASRPLPITVLPSRGLGGSAAMPHVSLRCLGHRGRFPIQLSHPMTSVGGSAAMPLDAARCLGHRGRFPIQLSDGGGGCDAPRCRAMPRASRPLPSTVLPSHGLGAQKNSRNPWSRVGRLRCPSMPSDASGSRCRLDALRCLGDRGRFPLEFSSRCPPMPRASSCFPTEFSDPMPSRCPLDALRCRGHRAASQQSSQIRCPRGVAF